MKRLFPLLLFFSWWEVSDGAEITSGQTPQHAVVADFNLDGIQDLAVANAFDDSVVIQLQDTQGIFPITQTLKVGINSFTPANLPRFLIRNDINRDGYPDLIVLCSGQFDFGYQPSVQSLLNDGDGTFVRLPATPTSPSFTAEELPLQFVEGEFTGDAYSDLAIANLEDRSVRILNGNGTGLFEIGQRLALDVSGEGPQDLTVFDQDRDGLDDLWAVTANAFVLLHQTAPGIFAGPMEYSLAPSPTNLRAITLDDLDVNGSVDAALADADGRVHVVYDIQIGGASTATDLLLDPSLSGCSDIITVQWDDDQIPDLAVTNRTGDSLTVFLSTGPVQIYPTGRFPRRTEAMGDLDGDGRIDIVTANEGDQSVPTNADVNLISNPGNPIPSFALTPDGDWLLDDAFDLNVPSARGVTMPDNSKRFWLLDADRRRLHETDSNGDGRNTIVFPFEVGGVHFKESNEGYVIERYFPRIREFHLEDGSEIEFEDSEIFSFDPGEVGFSGLAFDEGREEFYVSAPGASVILRVGEEEEDLEQFGVAIPPWDLTWDRSVDRLIAVNPGRSDVRYYTRTGTLDLVATKDLAATWDLFRFQGFSGVSWYEADSNLFILTTAGALLRWSPGTVDEPVPTSPTFQILGMDYDVNRGEMHASSGSGFFFRFEGSDFDDTTLYSVWPAIVSDPTFVPSGLAFDHLQDQVLVPGLLSPRAARFNRSGNFLGFVDFSSDIGAVPGPFFGFDLETPGGAEKCFGTSFHLHMGPPPVEIPLPNQRLRDLTWSDSGVLVSSRNPSEILFLAGPGYDTIQTIRLLSGEALQRMTFDDQQKLMTLEMGSATRIRRYYLEALSAAEHWNLYK